MRRLHLGCVAALLALVATVATAQHVVDPGDDLAVAVVIPPAMPGTGPAARTQLESRLSQVLTGTGLAAVPGGSTIVMYPGLVVLDETVVEGMQRRTVMKLDLSLFLKNASDGVLFASMSQEIAGVGANRDAALLNAVSSLRGSDPAIREFAAAARDRIIDYYARNCDRVIADGRAQAGTGDIARAMAVLLSVPRESAACHDRASTVAVRVFGEAQERDCQARLRKARAERAVRRFIGAIDALEGIDPSSPCAHEADRLLDDVSREVDRGEERELQIRIDTIQARKAPIARKLASPASITSRRLTLATEARVEWLNREPRPEYDAALFRN